MSKAERFVAQPHGIECEAEVEGTVRCGDPAVGRLLEKDLCQEHYDAALEAAGGDVLTDEELEFWAPQANVLQANIMHLMQCKECWDIFVQRSREIAGRMAAADLAEKALDLWVQDPPRLTRTQLLLAAKRVAVIRMTMGEDRYPCFSLSTQKMEPSLPSDVEEQLADMDPDDLPQA